MSGVIVDKTNGIKLSEIKAKLADCFPSTSDPNKIDSYRGLRYYDTDTSDDILIPSGKICFSDFDRKQCLPNCVFNTPDITVLQQPTDKSAQLNQEVTFNVRWRVDWASQMQSCPAVWNDHPAAVQVIWERKGPGVGSSWTFVEFDDNDFVYSGNNGADSGDLTLKLRTNQNNYHNHQFRATIVATVYGTTNYNHEGLHELYEPVAVSTVHSNAVTFTFTTVPVPGDDIIAGTWTHSGPLTVTYCQFEDEYQGGGTFTASISDLRVTHRSSAYWTPTYQGMTGVWEYYQGGWNRFAGDPGGQDYPRDAHITIEYPDIANGIDRGYGELRSRVEATGNEAWTPGGIFFSSLSHWFEWSNDYLTDNTSQVRLRVTSTTLWTNNVTGATQTRTTEKTFGGTSGLQLNTETRSSCDLIGPEFEYIVVRHTDGSTIGKLVEGQSVIVEAKLKNYMVNGEFTARELFGDQFGPYDFGNEYSVVFIANEGASVGGDVFGDLFGESNNMAASVDENGIARFTFKTSVNNQFTGGHYELVGKPGDVGNPGHMYHDKYFIKGLVYAGYKIGALPHPPLAVPLAQSVESPPVNVINRRARLFVRSSDQIEGGTAGDSGIEEGGEVQFTITGTNIPKSVLTPNGDYDGGPGTPVMRFELVGADDSVDVETGNHQGTFSMVYNSSTQLYEGSFSIVTREDTANFEDKEFSLKIFWDHLISFDGDFSEDDALAETLVFRILNASVPYTAPTFSDIGVHAGFCVPANQVPIEEFFVFGTVNGDGSYTIRPAPFNGGAAYSGNWHSGVPDEFNNRLQFFMTPEEIVAVNANLQTTTYINNETGIDRNEWDTYYVQGRISVINGTISISVDTDSPGATLGVEQGFWLGSSGTYSVKDLETGEVTNAVGSISVSITADNFRDRTCDDTYGNNCPELGTLIRYECRDNTSSGGTAFERWIIKSAGTLGPDGITCATIEELQDSNSEDCGYGTSTSDPQTDFTACEQYWNALSDWISNTLTTGSPGNIDAPLPGEFGCTPSDLEQFLIDRGIIPGGGTIPQPYGTLHSQYCGTGADSTTSYSVYHDGLGGFYTTTTYNSTLCGYSQYPAEGTFLRFECGKTETTKFTRYKITANGSGGEIRTVHEVNSTSCGYQAPSVDPEGTVISSYCGGFEVFGSVVGVKYTLYEVVADGQGGAYMRETPNSPDCGYEDEITPPVDHPPRGERSGRPYCGRGRDRYTQYQDYHDGNGGTYTEVVETNSRACGWRPEGTIATKPGGILAVNVTDPGRALLSDYPNTTGATYRGKPVVTQTGSGTSTTYEFTGSGAVFDIDTSPNATLTNAGITIVNGGQSYQVGDQFEATSVSFGGQLSGWFEVTQVVEQDNPPPDGQVGDAFCANTLPFNTYGEYALIKVVNTNGVPSIEVVEQNSTQCGYQDVVTPDHPDRGTASGAEYCGTGANQYTLYQNYHDGNGGTYTEVIERNSETCGYSAPVEYPERGTASGVQYCGTGANQYTLYQDYHDGRGGTYTETVETNSTTCGYVAPPPPPVHDPAGTAIGEPFCANTLGIYNNYGLYAKVQTFADGNGGFNIQVVESDSVDCGYTPPPAHPVRGTASGGAYCGTGANQYTRYQDYHDGSGGTYTEVLERNSTECGYAPPAPSHPTRGSASGEAYCGAGMNRFTLYQKYHDGNGGTYTEVVEFNSTECGYRATPTGPDRGGPSRGR